MIPKDLKPSSYTFEIHDKVFDEYPFCHDGKTIMFHEKIHHQLDTNQYSHPSQSKSESEPLYQKSNSSKFFFSNRLNERFDLLFIGTIYDSTTSSTDKSNPSLLFNQSRASNGNTQMKCVLQAQPTKMCCFFVSSPSIADKCHFREYKFGEVSGNIYKKLLLVHH